MKTTIIHLGLALLAGSTATARESKEPRGQRPPPPPVIAALDADRDGVISAEEIENASEALLALDKNGDGELTRDELHPQGPPPREGGRPPGPPPGGEPGEPAEVE
jgi:hypothetical protein